MSPEAKTPDLAPLAEALLLADVDDPASLAVLRELLQALTPWPIAEQASVADPALAECLAIVDETREGEGSAPLGRLSAALTPVMGLVTPGPQRPAKPAGAAGPAPATRRGAPAEPRSGAGARAVPRGGDKTPGAGPTPAAAAVAPAPGSLAGDPELVRDFAVSAREHLEQADGLLMSLEAVPDDAESVNSVFRAFHTIKGMAGFLDFTRIQDAAHEAESVLDGVRKGSDPLDQETIDTLFAAVDTLRSLVDEMTGAAGGTAEAVAEGAAGPPRGTAAPAVQRSEPPPGQAAAARRPPVTPRPAAPAATAKDQPVARAAGGGLAGGTVHVSGERLDRLCDTIGES